MSKMKYIYLAGPVEGCSDQEIHSWRVKTKLSLLPGIVGVNPDRIDNETPECIIIQNYLDAKSCDAILAYLPKEITDRRASYGTVFEIAWGYSMQKPVIIVSDDDYVHSHPVLKMSGVHFTELDDAIKYINQLFFDYVVT